MQSIEMIWTVKRFRWFDSGDIQSKKMLDDICHEYVVTHQMYYIGYLQRNTKIGKDYVYLPQSKKIHRYTWT